MKKRHDRRAIILAVGLLLSITPRVRANADIYWSYDDGFFPNSVQIAPGETVTWWNVDVFGFDARITLDDGLTFFLPNLTGQGVAFPSPGSYGFHSDFGDTGLVTVTAPPPPASLDLTTPRLEGNLFVFDATGLTGGRTNILEASADLMSWTAISTNIATDVTMTFTNRIAVPVQFFRLLELPAEVFNSLHAQPYLK